jgi:DNA-binding beta-propeller fold protein YncE
MSATYLRLSAALLSLRLFVITPNLTGAQPFTMYGAEFEFSGHFSRVNVATASLTAISTNSGGCYLGLDFEPATGKLWASCGQFLYIVDPATGRPLTTLSINGSSDVFHISFAPDGTLYGLGNNNGNLYRIDTATATATFIGTSGQSMFALEFGPGGVLYGCGFDLYRIDPNTGAATDLGRLVSGGSALFNDLDFAPNGVMYGATSQTTSDSFYRIDLPTATAALIGVTGGNLGSIASIPEPCSLALLALGGGLGFLWCIGPSKLRKAGTLYRLLSATVSSGGSRQDDTK